MNNRKSLTAVVLLIDLTKAVTISLYKLKFFKVLNTLQIIEIESRNLTISH